MSASPLADPPSGGVFHSPPRLRLVVHSPEPDEALRREFGHDPAMGKHRVVPHAWGQEIEAFGRAMVADGQSKETVKLRRYHLRRLAREVGDDAGPWGLDAGRLVDWLGGMEWKRDTRRSHNATFRAFWRWGMRTGRTGEDPTSSLGRVKPQPPSPHPAPEVAYAEALVAAPPRDALMLRLAAELGMRRGEVAVVHARDLLGSRGDYSLVVHGKGDKERVLPMADGLAREVRERADGGWLFPGQVDGHISPHWVGRLVSRLLPEGVSMHALRHKFASETYGIDRDIVSVQELLGHASLDTTRRYVLAPDDAKRRLVLAVGRRVPGERPRLRSVG